MRKNINGMAAVIIMLLSVGWVIKLASPSGTDRYLLIPAMSSDVDKGQRFCKGLKGQAGFPVGQIALYDSKGRHLSVSCGALLEALEGK